MEIDNNLSNFDAIEYEQLCRICLRSHVEGEIVVLIDETLQNQFIELIQVELPVIENQAHIACNDCFTQISQFHQFKLKIQETQILNFCPVDDDGSRIKNQQVEEELDKDKICVHCGMKFTKKNLLKRHIERVHLKHKNFGCKICDYECYFKYELSSHMKTHEDVEAREQFHCEHCDFTSISKISLRRHQVKDHQTNNSENNENSIKVKDHQSNIKPQNVDMKEICQICGIFVSNKYNLEKHVRRVHQKRKNFHCDICGYEGFFKFNIVDHMQKHLNFHQRVKFDCDEENCKFQSISKSSLRAHKRNEHYGQKRIYECHCGKIFTRNSSFYTHVKIVHEKLKKHVCSLCPKAFFEKSQLSDHVKTQHLKQKDLPCEVCGKLFSTRKHLSNHMKYHESPQFVCSFENCSSSFFTIAQLNSHLKVHTNQRDFQCGLCDKSYFHKSHLKKHLVGHGII